MMMRVISLFALLSLPFGVSGQSECSPACSSKATCVNGECLCNDGYVALANTSSLFCADLDECQAGLSGCDSENGFCVDYDPPIKFQCGCLPGYICQNFPACTTCVSDSSHACNINDGGCSPDATCIPLSNNGTTCECNPGFTGDGIVCTEDIAPTDAPTESCDCDLSVSTCVVSGGSTTCSCLPGFVTTARGQCLDINECSSVGLNNCTGGRAICVNLPGSHRCQCETGFDDFPGTIRGTDCRTPEEIELVLNTGALYDVTTGLSGLTVDDFAEGSAARTTLAQYYADRFSLNASDVEFSNVTDVSSSRRLSTEGRELQGANTLSFLIRFRIRYNRRITQSNVERAADLAATFINRIFTEISNFFLDIGTPESVFAAGYLAGVRDTFIANEVDVDDINDVTRTRPNELTFTTSAISLSEVTVQQAIDLGEVDNPTSNLFVQFFQNQGFSGTPTAAPSGTRRFLEDVEEEDFFGDFATDIDASSCKCIDCDPVSTCQDLWKGREAMLVDNIPESETHVVVSHCDKDLGWVPEFLKGVRVASITIISGCGKEPTNAPFDATILSSGKYSEDYQSFLSWIVHDYDEGTDGSILFLKDSYVQASTGAHLVSMAEKASFGCGVVPGTTSDSVSLSAFCRTDGLKQPFWDKAGIKIGREILQVCESGAFATTWKAVRQQDKILWENLHKLADSSVSELWAGLLAEPLAPEDLESITNYSNGEVNGCLSHSPEQEQEVVEGSTAVAEIKAEVGAEVKPAAGSVAALGGVSEMARGLLRW